jgi:hypothetical protein
MELTAAYEAEIKGIRELKIELESVSHDEVVSAKVPPTTHMTVRYLVQKIHNLGNITLHHFNDNINYKF